MFQLSPYLNRVFCEFNMDKSYNYSVRTQELQDQSKKELVSKNNVIKIGGFSIKWSTPSHHLAYKRFEALGWHTQKKCSLQDAHTADYEKYSDFDLTKSDKCFEAMAKRILKQSQYLTHVRCIGCGGPYAPSTDNNPTAWHMKCWRLCLDSHPKAADGYVYHLEQELAPRVHKLFPKLTASQFYALYGICEDIFWLRLFDLKTKGKYIKIRMNNSAYSGICSDFSLDKMGKNNMYANYVLKMLSKKHYWYSMNTTYNCITVKSYIEYSMREQENKAKTQSVIAPNSNNQASKPQWRKNNTE